MKKCFVISPIGEEGSEVRKSADDLLKYVIEPACNAKGYEAIRADKISDAGMITQSIIEHILQDDIAVIDITGRNANVFYELAIRHSYGLPAIQIAKDITDIPFDIHNVRTIQYDLSASGADIARQAIEKAIESIEAGKETLNPVTSVSNILKISHGDETENNAVLSELLLKVNSIPEKLDSLENNIGIRFSQMLTAFGESFKSSSHPTSEQNLQDAFLSNFMSTILNDPQKGMSQMQNLMAAQKFMKDNGWTDK